MKAEPLPEPISRGQLRQPKGSPALQTKVLPADHQLWLLRLQSTIAPRLLYYPDLAGSQPQ